MKATLPKPITSNDPVVILKAVIKAIREEPKRYDQGTYLDLKRGDAFRPESYWPKCGTVACVAGWVSILKGKHPRKYGAQRVIAEKLLSLNQSEAEELFRGKPERVRRRSETTPSQHAADGIKHIQRFVLKKWGKKI